MRILIVGGGIGGLTAAHALGNAGFEVRVFEKMPASEATGAGIWIPPNGMKVLAKLDLAEAAIARGVELDEVALIAGKGQVLGQQDMAAVKADHGFKILSIARAKLHQTMLENLSEVHFDQCLETIEEKPGCVVLRFESGLEVDGDLVIGADGLNSKTRELVFGSMPLRYSGQTCWRGMANIEGLDFLDRQGREIWVDALRFGFSRVDETQAYWFAAKKAPRNQKIPAEKLRDHLLETFAAFPEMVGQLIKATPNDRFLHHDLLDLKPFRPWATARVALLGDAAHPMTPNLGQGGAQAMVDAYVLAKILGQSGALENKLQQYEARRYRITAPMVRQSDMFGKLAVWRNPLAVWFRNVCMKAMPQSLLQKQLAKAYAVED